MNIFDEKFSVISVKENLPLLNDFVILTHTTATKDTNLEYVCRLGYFPIS
jgi:hypothetical protein